MKPKEKLLLPGSAEHFEIFLRSGPVVSCRVAYLHQPEAGGAGAPQAGACLMGRWGGAPVLGWAPWEKAANCGCCGRPLTLFLLLRPHFPSMFLAVMPSVGVGTFVWWPFLPESNLWDETMSWCQAPLSRVQWAWRGQEGLTSTAGPGDISLRVVAWGPCSSALASMCIVLQHAVVADLLLDSSVWDSGDWRKAASDQGTHSPWWWALLRGSASRPGEKPHSVATGENPAGAGTGAVISLLSGSTLCVELSSDSNAQVTLAFGFHTKVRPGGGEGGTGWGSGILSAFAPVPRPQFPHHEVAQPGSLGSLS